MPVAGNPHAGIKIEEHVHERLGVGNLHDGPVRKYPLDGILENRPVVFSVEIVDEQEPATKAVFPEPGSILSRRPPVAPSGLLQKQKWVLEYPVIGQFEMTLIICNLNICRAAQRGKEMFLG